MNMAWQWYPSVTLQCAKPMETIQVQTREDDEDGYCVHPLLDWKSYLVALVVGLPLGDAVLLRDVPALGHHLGVLNDVHALRARLSPEDLILHVVRFVGRLLHVHAALRVGHHVALYLRHLVAHLKQALGD